MVEAPQSVGFDGSSVGAASETFENSTFPFLITRTVSLTKLEWICCGQATVDGLNYPNRVICCLNYVGFMWVQQTHIKPTKTDNIGQHWKFFTAYIARKNVK